VVLRQSTSNSKYPKKIRTELRQAGNKPCLVPLATLPHNLMVRLLRDKWMTSQKIAIGLVGSKGLSLAFYQRPYPRGGVTDLLGSLRRNPLNATSN